MVSVIVPVYNAEKSLARCIESIINQEYKEIELLLMNDGSKDSSGQICDEYAKKDERIRVVHKENSGVSDTRNKAIEMARGDYIQFVDADDWLTPDATKLLVREAEQNNVELVIADFYRVVGNRVSHKGSIKEAGVLSRDEFAEHMMESPADFYYGVLWNKLFRKDIITQNNIHMDEKISWCEDFLFNLEYLMYTKKVSVLQVPIYYYLKTEGSLVSQSKNVRKVVQMKLKIFEVYNEFYKKVYDKEEYTKNLLSIYRYLVDVADDSLISPRFLGKTKELGEERVSVAEQIVSEKDYITVHYKNEKLLDRYLQEVGFKYSLSLNDMKTLVCVSQMGIIKSRKELADYSGISVSTLSRCIQKLLRKNIIDIEKEKKSVQITITEDAETIFAELNQAFEDYDNVRFAGMTEEEIGKYLQFQKRIDQNISLALK